MDITALPHHEVMVKGSRMHYLTLGRGKPVVFIHGIPTSSYIWRKVIAKPGLRNQCFLVDLIGMGESDKPKIQYSINDHIEYFRLFMEGLDLTQPATLVMHGWGSIIGLAYARMHPDKIKGIVLIEPYFNLSEEYTEISSTVSELVRLASDDPEKLRYIMIEENYMVEKIMPMLMARRIPDDDFNVYRKPFEQKENRQILFQFALEQPHRDINSPVVELVKQNTQWLCESNVPKLLMYARPGFLTRMNNVIWTMNHFPNLTLVEVGNDIHYLPETCAPKIEETLSNWLLEQK
jgi:haloalkane dehalogenase